jgi:ribonuclease HII
LPEGFEAKARANGFSAPAGVDEAGRGPLAGPVVAAAVILPEGYDHPLIRVSKALSPARRERAFLRIVADAVAWAVAEASPAEIDAVNILQASLLAMGRAVAKLPVPPDFLYVDGTFPVPLPLPQETLVRGDSRCRSVSAASILAKVTRDAAMLEHDRAWPGYGFASHKGYPTKAHLDAIRRLGPCPIHRTTFRGVAG